MRALLLITVSWLLAFTPPVQAEDSSSPANSAHPSDTGLRRFEIGIQTADLRTGCIGSAQSCPLPSFALGASGAMNLNQHFSLDANFLITPQSASYITNTFGGHASELLLGARAEMRARHYGFFLKAQPGYFSWSHLITGVTYPTPSNFVFSYGGGRISPVMSEPALNILLQPASTCVERSQTSSSTKEVPAGPTISNHRPVSTMGWGSRFSGSLPSMKQNEPTGSTTRRILF